MLTEPVEYDVMAHLMNAAHLVLTDSGGIQEEAPALGKPVLVLRTETERPEAVEAGTAKLIGPYAERIVAETERLLRDQAAYHQMAQARQSLWRRPRGRTHRPGPFIPRHLTRQVVPLSRSSACCPEFISQYGGYSSHGCAHSRPWI